MEDTQIMTAADLKAEIAAREAKAASAIKREEKRV
jgi:hypothetical protein